MDLRFIEEYKSRAQDLSREEYNMEELQFLGEIAENIGSYLWKYDGDDKAHEGVITQDLLRVPGLKAAVVVDPETGLQTLDTRYVATAALGAVAALCRAISKIQYAGPAPEGLKPEDTPNA